MNQTHHAVLYRASSVSDFDVKKTDEIEFNDFFIESFGVDDARELIRKASTRPVEKKSQTFIVRVNFITFEAQNALLKVIEEPPLSIAFIFVIPPDLILLDTLSSRLNYQTNEHDNELTVSNNFEIFAKQNYKERIASIDEAAKKQDTDWQRQIKQGLVKAIERGDYVESLGKLEFVARFLLTRGASNKMLLEHLALILPSCR